MDTLTGYEIHFDLERNEISIIKTPNFDDEKSISITIRAANSAELEQLKAKIEQGNGANFAADVQILS
jgi:type II secretory pathway component PulL